MGLIERFDRKLESTVGDAFARMFGGSIVPQEVEGMLRREAADGVRSLQGGRLLAPNEYVITLSVSDYQKVSADPVLTANALPSIWAATSAIKDGKRMVTWLCASRSRRTYTPVRFVRAGSSTLMPATTRLPAPHPSRAPMSPSRHNQTRRLPQNQEYHR